MRRYDVDWLRILALGLLIIYHISVVFQPWAYFIYFVQSEKPVESIWLAMGLINIWRIPLLFIISGMGVCFSMRRRGWKELLKDRTRRILLPLIFGSLFIVPIHGYIYQSFIGLDHIYFPNPGHLWFLINIFIYVLVLCPVFFYLKRNPDSILLRLFERIFKFPPALYLITLPFIFEAELIALEQGFEAYANTPHGFWLGLLAFITGFIFISIGDVFWQAVGKIKGLALAVAIPLFLVRMIIFQFQGPFYLIVIESWSWLFAVFGFGSTYLNRPSKKLTYLSKAVYPVYILHMIFLYLASDLVLTRPVHVDQVHTIKVIEPDSPAAEAGLLPGDHLITKFEDWKPRIPLEINVNRKEDSMKISITPDEKGNIGADFTPIPFFMPKYTQSDITTFFAFLQFILINVMTFGGCFIGYEIIRRIKWLRLFFGMKMD